VSLPLLRDLHPEQVLAFDRHGTRSVARLLADAARLAELLPARPFMLNDCGDRYHFLVALVAAMLRRQVALLPPSRIPHVWEQLREDYPASYAVTDFAAAPVPMDVVHIPTTADDTPAPAAVPTFPADQPCAIVFTSGSTGRPKACPKTWGMFVGEALCAGAALSLRPDRPGALVATVPAQHMYGFLTSIMMPLQWGYAFNRDKPFYPEDIRLTLEAAPAVPVLVVTPVQLRACVLEKAQLPPLDFILSAAAPLPRVVADGAEAQFGAPVREIFGSTETGAIALRRQQDSESWRTFDGIHVHAHADGFEVHSGYFDPVVLTDMAEIRTTREFQLLGRNSDLVKIGGKRTSLAYLNQQLLDIDGVLDGAFLLDEGKDGHEPRLSAFVVGPGHTHESILVALRERIDEVFMPRRLWRVAALPRNATGKLPRESILRLRAELESARS
jgi:acyl-coenzyme A synthetase/AMP-(fatty) acid ligase